jgi:hypothetical protein
MTHDQYNEHMREYMLARYHARRAEAIEILGGECAWCGSTEDLQIDHRDWREKTLKINNAWSAARARFLAELEKCQVLCAPHHLEKTRRDMREIRAAQGWKNQYGSGPMKPR